MSKLIKSKTATCLILLLGLLMCLTMFGQPAYASPTVITAAFPVFNSSNITTFNLVGTAALSGNSLLLTPSSGGVNGSGWWEQKISLKDHRSFSAYYTFDISQPSHTGGDGLVFALQTQSNGAGGSGGGLGYSGIAPSLGVEYDIYYNDTALDIDGNHVGIDLNGNMQSLVQVTADPIGVLEDGSLYHSWVDYDGNTGSLEVRLAKNSTRPVNALISRSINLETYLEQDVYVGFTAATGLATARHEIDSFYFSNDFIPGGIDPANQEYTTAATSVELMASPPRIQVNVQNSYIIATVKDINGDPMPGQTVVFTTDLGMLDPGSAVTDNEGKARVSLSSRRTGIATVRGTADGGAYGETQVEIIRISGVGGMAEPVDRLAVLAPWLLLGLGVLAAFTALWLKLRAR